MALTDKERMELLNLRKRVEAQRTTIKDLQGTIERLRDALERYKQAVKE